MRVAIHINEDIFKHSTNWCYEWINQCINHQIEYKIVDCFSNNIYEDVIGCDILLWHFNNYSLQEMLFARSIIHGIENLGLEVFPNTNTSWHFDDKIAEMYLLKSIGAPIPKAWTFYTLKSALDFFELECTYPIVAKLRCGSGSNNVKLISNKTEAAVYAKAMFGIGIKSSPNPVFKLRSNMLSTKGIKQFFVRVKRIPDFIMNLEKSKSLPREKGYVYLQEFVPNDGYDLKVVVVGNKLSFLARSIRKGDFRASGGGMLSYNKNLISKDIINSAFKISDNLGFQCMGYDFVIDNQNGKARIIEISYGFSHEAIIKMGSYLDREGTWHEANPLNAPEEILLNMLKL